MNLLSRDTECPENTRFYVCALNNYRGCCSTDPCNSAHGCVRYPGPSSDDAPSAVGPDTTPSITSSTNVPRETALPSSSSAAVPAPTEAPTPPLASPSHAGPTPTLIMSLSVAVGTITILVLVLLVWVFRARLARLLHFRRTSQTNRVAPPPPSHVFELDGQAVCPHELNTDGGNKT